MIQRTVALVGLSGVGKSTFLTKLNENLSFQHLQASNIISLQKQFLKHEEVSQDGLRFVNIMDNQDLLIEGFHRLIDKNANLVILDGHTLIDTPSGIAEIPSIVFRNLKIDLFIFLSDTPDEIAKRRDNDIFRKRPKRRIEEIYNHQLKAINITINASLELRIPLILIEASQMREIEIFLKNFTDFYSCIED